MAANTRSSLLVLWLLAVLLVACHRPQARTDGSREGNVAMLVSIPVHPIQRLACFSPESLAIAPVAFGALDTAHDGTEDVEGSQVTFAVRDGQLLGMIRSAYGEIPRHSEPLQRIRFSPNGDSLLFVWKKSSSEHVHQMRVSCDSLWGRVHLWVTATDTGQLAELSLMRAKPVPDKP